MSTTTTKQSKTTKPVTTPEPKPEPTTPEPKPVATIADFNPDDAKIDRKPYTEAFGQLTVGLTTFASGVFAAGEGSRIGSLALVSLRESIRRVDNDAPDYAGTTSAYTEALGSFLDRFAAANTFEKPDGTTSQITTAMVKQYRSRISSYMSSNQVLHRAMAEHEARTNSKAAATLAEVQAAWNAEAGTPLPANVVANERAAMVKQVSSKGKTLQHFDPDKNVARVAGPKPKPGSDAGSGGDNASEALPVKQWAAVRKQIEKGEGGHLPPAKLAEEVLHVVSLAVLSLVGPVGEKLTPAADLPGGGVGRADAIATYGQIEALLHAMIGATGKDKNATKDAMADLLWSEASE